MTDPEREALLELARVARMTYAKPSVRASNPALGEALARYDRVRRDIDALTGDDTK